MKNFHIEYPDESFREALIDKINNLTKPKGSLGVLEDLALQIGLIQQTLSPTLSHPHNVLFAADHGIVEEGVSKSPKEITWQQLSNFCMEVPELILCRQHGFKLVLVDSGVDYDLPYEKGIINCSVGRHAQFSKRPRYEYGRNGIMPGTWSKDNGYDSCRRLQCGQLWRNGYW